MAKHTERCASFGCTRFAPKPTPVGRVICYGDPNPQYRPLVAVHLCGPCQQREDRRAKRTAVLMTNIARASWG